MGGLQDLALIIAVMALCKYVKKNQFVSSQKTQHNNIHAKNKDWIQNLALEAETAIYFKPLVVFCDC